MPETKNGKNATESAASNTEAAGDEQLLSKEAEKYLRDAGNIEDLPDEDDQQKMDKTIADEKKLHKE